MYRKNWSCIKVLIKIFTLSILTEVSIIQKFLPNSTIVSIFFSIISFFSKNCSFPLATIWRMFCPYYFQLWVKQKNDTLAVIWCLVGSDKTFFAYFKIYFDMPFKSFLLSLKNTILFSLQRLLVMLERVTLLCNNYY